MKIPAKIKSGPHIFDVIMVDDVIASPGGGAVGETNYGANTIRLTKTRSRSRLELTFFHELCHVAFESQGLQNRYMEIEEEIVDNIATGLYALLVENGLLK